MVYNEVAEDEKQGKEGMNMNPVIVRNVRIGEGMPKICVPVVGRTRAEIREAAAYVELNRRMSGAGYIDMVDVEMFSGDDTVSALVRCAHACQVKVVALTMISEDAGEGGDCGETSQDAGTGCGYPEDCGYAAK